MVAAMTGAPNAFPSFLTPCDPKKNCDNHRFGKKENMKKNMTTENKEKTTDSTGGSKNTKKMGKNS